MASFRSRPAALLVALVVSLATAAAASAQTTPLPVPSTANTTATTVPTTSTTLFLGLFPPPTTATSSTTASVPTKVPATTAAPPTTTLAGPGGDGDPPPGASTVIPADVQRQIDAIKRTGAKNTTGLLAALQPLVAELGMTPTDAAIAAGGRFPIAGPTTWVDDWLFPRFVPAFHLHKGLDMFAAMGTPVRAPFDGTLKFSTGAVGGMAAYVTQKDGTFVYLAHLSGFAPGKTTGQAVRTGDVVGFVGDSGNARGGSPHVHLELHPRGGAAAPPKPTIDAWLAEATANAPQVIAALRAARASAPPPSGASVSAVSGPAGAEVEAIVDPTAILWAAASNPSIGTIDLASSLVAGAAAAISWPKPQG